MMPAPQPEPGDTDLWAKPVRPAVFPILVLPEIVSDIGGVCLVVSAGLVVLGAALQAVTFRVASPSPSSLAGGSLGFTFRAPALSFWDRLAIFGRAGASLQVAVALMVGMLILGLSAVRPGRRQRAAIVAAGLLASVIVVVDAVTCIKVLNNSVSQYSGVLGTNKAAAILGLLAPSGIAAAVGLTAWFRLTAQVEETQSAE